VNPNKSVIEDTLRQKVKKMRDETLIKILLQGILPKFKAELYLRMPEDDNDFEAFCKQLIISEQILQNKESSEDKELTAVIAGITHHEKQQDDELNQQKLEIGNLKQNIAELETYSKKRHSSQEHLATVAAVDHYDSRRTSSLDRHQRKDPRVQFSRPSSSQSRDSSFHASKDEIAVTHVAGTKVQHITGIRTTTKGRIPTINLDFKATIETEDPIIRDTIVIGTRIRITEIILSGQTITVAAKIHQVHKGNSLPLEEI
jgi:hypothetical protein